MLYVIVDTLTRKPQRVGVKPLFAVENETLLTFPELLAEPSSREFAWDTATDAYVTEPSFAPRRISRTKISKREFLTFPELLAEPSSREFAWDTATDAYVTEPSFAPRRISRTKISKREFRNRLGRPVRLAILSIRESTSAELSMPRRVLTDMKETLDAESVVDLADADTIAGVNELLALGLIVADDVTRLLAPSTVAAE